MSQQPGVWVFQCDPRSIKLVRASYESQKMIAAFFGKYGYTTTVPFYELNQSLVYHNLFSERNCRTQKRNSRIRTILNQDMASSHIVSLNMDFLK